MWNKSDAHPDHDCEVFVIAKDLERGEKICQIDFYNAEEDCFLDCDGEKMCILYWQEIRFPELPPELQDEKIPVLVHIFGKPKRFPVRRGAYTH